MVTNTAQDTSKVIKAEGLKKIRTIKAKVKSFSRSKKARKNNPVARSLTEQAYRSGKNALVSAYHSAGEVGGKVRRAMPRLALDLNRRDINRTIRTVVDDRPVVLGIIGFGVGVALAAVIPIFSHQGKSRK